ncbi:MAG: transposase [Pirellulales bacterium]
MTDDYASYIGLDVAKLKFDAYLAAEKRSCSFDNDAPGIEKLLEKLPPPGTCLIVVESTGIYHRALVAALVDQDHHVAIANPRRVRDFASALGILAKTDKIDAKVIGKYAETATLRLVEKDATKQAEFMQLITRRRQLVEMRKRELQHLSANSHRVLLKSIKLHIQNLSEQIKEIEALLTEHVEKDHTLQAKSEILRSVPGVGDVTAFTILADLPELGTLNRGEIAALAGVAPFNADSGQQRGQRHIRGGRGKLRKSLYMSVISAITHNPLIRAFSERLKAANKPHKVVVVACIRKLLTILNTMLKTNTAWKY